MDMYIWYSTWNSCVSHDSHMTPAVHTCRSMGENLEEVEEFDRRMQSVAEGTYHPSHSAMETFPVRYNIVIIFTLKLLV